MMNTINFITTVQKFLINYDNFCLTSDLKTKNFEIIEILVKIILNIWNFQAVLLIMMELKMIYQYYKKI